MCQFEQHKTDTMQTIDNYDFKGKKAIIRVDFNVPLNERFEITDDTRIKGALPTIRKILERGGSTVLMSHLGRPKSGPEEKFSLRHLVSHLSHLLKQNVGFADDCIGKATLSLKKDLKPGEVLLLENLRFHPEETKGDEAFSEKLAEGMDVYVNDAFGTAHRAHASTTIIARFFPENKLFGYLIERELSNLEKVLKQPEKPFTAVMGGAKVSDKIQVIENLMNIVDNLIIGGGMTYTFVRALGGNTGSSLVEEDKLDLAADLLKKAKKKNINLVIPEDNIIADKFENDASRKESPADQIPEGWMGLDIGPATIKKTGEIIGHSKTILWNGPMGVFEMENFQKGTVDIARAIADATSRGAYSLVGGGDSVAAVNRFGLAGRITHVSTGGGAMLEYIEGKELPGIAAIRDQ